MKDHRYCSYCGAMMVTKEKMLYDRYTGKRVTFLECPNYKTLRTLRIIFGIQEFHDSQDYDKWEM